LKIFELLKLLEERLQSVSGSAKNEAELIALSVLKNPLIQSRFELYQRLNEHVLETQHNQAVVMAERRATGYPLQYLTGEQGFLNHVYKVNPSVLVPRPETEILVTSVIELLKIRAAAPLKGIEVGIGSGIISIELLDSFKNLRMIASEASEDAFKIANRNANEILGAESARLKILHVENPSQVLEPFASELPSFLVSNPPYLIHSKGEALESVDLHEPHMALHELSGQHPKIHGKR
jgi:release factor glutamine methyltransferase